MIRRALGTAGKRPTSEMVGEMDTSPTSESDRERVVGEARRHARAEGEKRLLRTPLRESPYVARTCHVALIEF